MGCCCTASEEQTEERVGRALSDHEEQALLEDDPLQSSNYLSTSVSVPQDPPPQVEDTGPSPAEPVRSFIVGDQVYDITSPGTFMSPRVLPDRDVLAALAAIDLILEGFDSENSDHGRIYGPLRMVRRILDGRRGRLAPPPPEDESDPEDDTGADPHAERDADNQAALRRYLTVADAYRSAGEERAWSHMQVAFRQQGFSGSLHDGESDSQRNIYNQSVCDTLEQTLRDIHRVGTQEVADRRLRAIRNELLDRAIRGGGCETAIIDAISQALRVVGPMLVPDYVAPTLTLDEIPDPDELARRSERPVEVAATRLEQARSRMIRLRERLGESPERGDLDELRGATGQLVSQAGRFDNDYRAAMSALRIAAVLRWIRAQLAEGAISDQLLRGAVVSLLPSTRRNNNLAMHSEWETWGDVFEAYSDLRRSLGTITFRDSGRFDSLSELCTHLRDLRRALPARRPPRDGEEEPRPSPEGGHPPVVLLPAPAPAVDLAGLVAHYQAQLGAMLQEGTFSAEYHEFVANTANAFATLQAGGLSGAAAAYLRRAIGGIAGALPQALDAHPDPTVQEAVFDMVDLHHGRYLWALLRLFRRGGL